MRNSSGAQLNFREHELWQNKHSLNNSQTEKIVKEYVNKHQFQNTHFFPRILMLVLQERLENVTTSLLMHLCSLYECLHSLPISNSTNITMFTKQKVQVGCLKTPLCGDKYLLIDNIFLHLTLKTGGTNWDLERLHNSFGTSISLEPSL